MTDKEEIKFAIRYLKKGLKSKRTPPLYEVLMNELGFVREKELFVTMQKIQEENLKLRKAYNLCDEANINLKEEIKALRKELNERSWMNLEEELTETKELIEKYRQAVDKCLHITFMGGGCEVNTIGQYATLVDGYLTDVEGLDKWKN